MILINNLRKKYNGNLIFENVNLIFKDKGFYSIFGKSGCGKSTILNCLSSLDNDYEGEIIIDGINLKNLIEKERRNFRIKNFGFVFQSFNLFENLTVINNLFLVANSDHLRKDDLVIKIDEILKFLGIYELKDEYVKNLSGGEKQRVAIARALINDSKIIFCDEPTGSLDEKSSLEIFKFLKQLSKDHLIICVSHDFELVSKFSDYIYYFKDNKLVSNPLNDKTSSSLFISKEVNFLAPKLKLKSIYEFIKNTFKTQKLRYLLSSSILSISLICLGISLLISSNVSSGINKAFSSIIDDKSLILKKKKEDNEIIRYGASNDDLSLICNEYNEYVDYYGVRYLNNFSDFFIDKNQFYVLKNNLLKEISFLNFQNINNFEYIDNLLEYDLENQLLNDEIVITMDYSAMEDLCFALEIVRSYESINEYIKENGLKLVLKTANYYRQYEDEQIFNVKKIIQSPYLKVLHTNELFNEYILETMMRFPSTTNIDANYEIPWVLKKLYYIKTKTFQTTFIDKFLLDKRFKEYVLEGDSSFYSPSQCKVGELCYSNRVFVYKVINNLFDYSIIDELEKFNSDFNTYYYSTPLGYYNYGESMLNGFSYDLYFSTNENEIDSLENNLQKIKKENFENLSFESKILKGSLLDNSANNVKFNTKYDGSYQGKEELNSNEIVISSKMTSLLNEKNIINKDLFCLQNYEQTFDGKDYFNKFKKVKLKIVGIVDSNKVSIYQKASFSISFFRDLLETSSFYLIPNSIVYEFDKKPSKEIIEKINNSFHEYVLIDPYDQINNSVSEVFSYINLALVIFTIFASISSIVLLFVINTINFEEGKRDISILIALGFQNKEINKLELAKNFGYTIPGMCSSIFSIIVISFLLKDILNSSLGLNVPYSLPLLSIGGIVILTLIISFISFIFIAYYFNKQNIIKNLH